MDAMGTGLAPMRRRGTTWKGWSETSTACLVWCAAWMLVRGSGVLELEGQEVMGWTILAAMMGLIMVFIGAAVWYLLQYVREDALYRYSAARMARERRETVIATGWAVAIVAGLIFTSMEGEIWESLTYVMMGLVLVLGAAVAREHVRAWRAGEHPLQEIGTELDGYGPGAPKRNGE